MSLKDVDRELALKLRNAWKTIPHRKPAREAVDKLFGSYGVEFLGVDKRTHHDVYYCNAGDAYTLTIIFIGSTMRVGCWADFAESNRLRDPNALV